MALSPALKKMVSNAKKKYARADGKTVKFAEGKTTFRLLAEDFNVPFWRDLGVHWIRTEKNGKPVAVVGCNSETYDKPCDVCAAIEVAAREAVDDETLDLVKSMKARRVILVPALVRKAPGDAASDDPQILEMTPTTWSKILEIIDEYGEETDVFDLKDGLDFVVTRTGKGLDTEYTVMPAPKSQPVDAAVLKNLPDIDQYIESNFFRGEEQKALNAIATVSGGATALPTASSKKLLTNATVDDDDEDEVEVEEVKPTKARKTKSAPKVEDEVDEDDLDNDAEVDALLDDLGDLD
ncbi:MAG: hypothetical protein JJ979_03585 [Roseibium sp.]|nr:hypothetical protein [Roseibium sp.]